MGKIACVFLGGGAGSVARYLVGKAIVQRFPAGPFAAGTFAVNVTGSLLIGFLATLIVERLHLQHEWYLALVVGVLGGYTTFSSFEYDAYLAVHSGHSGMALLYLASSVVLGFAGVLLGVWAANRF